MGSFADDHFNVITLMKQKLPEYIVNCLTSSGYDELEVLCGMDTSEAPNNTIAKVESYINRKYVSKVEYNPDLSTPFEFSPGHRERICNFIGELKKLQKSRNASNKKRHTSHYDSSTSKRQKCSWKGDDGSEDNYSDSANTETVSIEAVYKQVRSSLKAWMKKQEDIHFKQLQEDKHYSLQVVPKKSPGFFSVLLRCSKCRVSIQLQQKDNSDSAAPYLISNWTRHLKSCLAKNENKSQLSQCNIRQCFFRSSNKSSATSSDSVGNFNETESYSDSCTDGDTLPSPLPVNTDLTHSNDQVF